MQQDGLDADFIGHRASMLAAGAAERHQHILVRIVTALDRDLLDCRRHALVGDAEEAFGDRLRCDGAAGFCLDLGAKCGELFDHNVAIKRLIDNNPRPLTRDAILDIYRRTF